MLPLLLLNHHTLQAPSEQHEPLDAAPHLAQHSQALEASDAQVDDKKLINAGSSIEVSLGVAYRQCCCLGPMHHWCIGPGSSTFRIVAASPNACWPTVLRKTLLIIEIYALVSMPSTSRILVSTAGLYYCCLTRCLGLLQGSKPVHALDAHLKPAAGGTAAPLSDVVAAGPSTPAETLSPVGTPQGLIQALEALHQTLNLDLQKVVTGHQVVHAKMMGNMGVLSKSLMKVLTHMDAQRPRAAQAAMSIKECHEAMLGGLEAAHCCSASLFDSANRLQTLMALTKHSLL